MRCPHCREKLLQKSGDTTKMRTDGPVMFTGQSCKTRCYWCKADVELPVRLNWNDASAARTQLVIRRKR